MFWVRPTDVGDGMSLLISKRPKGGGEEKALRDSRPVRNGPASRNAQPQTDKSGIRVGKRKNSYI